MVLLRPVVVGAVGQTPPRKSVTDFSRKDRRGDSRFRALGGLTAWAMHAQDDVATRVRWRRRGECGVPPGKLQQWLARQEGDHPRRLMDRAGCRVGVSTCAQPGRLRRWNERSASFVVVAV